MALIILADIIAARGICKDGRWLSIEDAVGIVKSKAEVDTAGRAFSYIMSVIAENPECFDTENWSSTNSWEGRTYWWRIKNDGTVYINKSVLERELSKKSFEFAAVKKKWAENGWLMLASGRYYANISLNKVKTYYVILATKKA